MDCIEFIKTKSAKYIADLVKPENDGDYEDISVSQNKSLRKHERSLKNKRDINNLKESYDSKDLKGTIISKLLEISAGHFINDYDEEKQMDLKISEAKFRSQRQKTMRSNNEMNAPDLTKGRKLQSR